MCLHIKVCKYLVSNQPFKSPRCIKASFYIPENNLNFPKTRGFRTKIPIKLVYQYMVIFFCDSNSRLVVDEDDKGKLRPERVKQI